MRFRHFHVLSTLLLAQLGLAQLHAEDAVENPDDPRLHVHFRTAAFGRDMRLRAVPRVETTAIATTTTPKAPVPVAPNLSTKTPESPKLAKIEPVQVPRISATKTTRSTASLPPGGEALDLQPTSFTPYDGYLDTVRTVIANLQPHPASLAAVTKLMKEGHSFEYVTRDPYHADTPATTAAQRAGDCKSKALWLYNQLGDADALYVIGKNEKQSPTSHAWVYWRSQDRWWILDCTDRSEPIAADSVPPNRYIPYYSFGKNGGYRHKSTRMVVAETTAETADPIVANAATKPAK